MSSADTWEFKTLSVGGDTSGTWLADTGIGLALNICVAGGASRTGAAGAWAGSDYSGAASTTNGVAATSATFQITGVIVVPAIELPAADRAALIMRSFEQELRLCERYWEKSYDYGTTPAAITNLGSLVNVTQAATLYCPIAQGRMFAARKRIAPTMTFYNPADGNTANPIRLNNATSNDPILVDSAGEAAFSAYVNNTSAAQYETLRTHFVPNARL